MNRIETCGTCLNFVEGTNDPGLTKLAQDTLGFDPTPSQIMMSNYVYRRGRRTCSAEGICLPETLCTRPIEYKAINETYSSDSIHSKSTQHF